jgi:hypothetical protein
MRPLRAGLIAALSLALLIGALPSAAQTQVCQVTEQATEAILPGTTLTWDSSFRCVNAPDSGQYEITVTITYQSGDGSIVITDAPLAFTTPPQAPAADATATGLPFTLNPGESASFTVTGSYGLAQTGANGVANLHFRPFGEDSSGVFFQLGVNVALRSFEDDDMDDPDEGEGPPPWAGPPAWAGDDRGDDDREAGPPPWAGPPAWAGDDREDDDDRDDDDRQAGPPPWAGPPQGEGRGEGRPNR